MFIGLDVHARSVAAGLLGAESGEVRSCSAPARSAELVSWLQAQGESISVAYEAGPTGFGLARACAAVQIPCLVAAPSRILRASGERVKTDRRDAMKLAKLLRLGELTAVRVPSLAEEGARDLVRAREDARSDLMRARHRLSKLFLRKGLVWEASAWTQAHERWLAAQRFEERGLQVAYGEAVAAVESVRARRDALDAAIVEEAAKEPWARTVGRLSCLRGVSTLSAFGLAAEIGDWQRFDGRSIGAYLGLTPSENSSGERRSQGAITKTGNGHTPGACSSRLPGTSDGRCRIPAVSLCAAARASRPWCACAPRRRAGACRSAGAASMRAASAPRWPPWPWPVSWPAGAGAWRRWTPEAPTLDAAASASGPPARGACATRL
jgi:transposase